MIIGKGMLASAFAPAFADAADVLVFASGVSNSRETRPEAFARERALLEAALPSAARLVYFSTCSVEDPALQDAPYVRHKRALEALVRERAERYAIFRLPQVVGRTPNPHTLTNFLAQQIRSGQPIQVWTEARRNLIDVDDVAAIAGWILRTQAPQQLVANIACPFSIGVPELVALFARVLGRPAQTVPVAAGGRYPIDTTLTETAAQALGIRFDDDYLPQLIRKYYADA
ncbi:NAD(P)-dependent oxidoreductase [Massilia sp. TS11]|uniref:NAD-dependent epimerase/dehydratase family protein n=1 Tax=Massilia sp. TS11 TaxID=2908003 RepID=UPI001EDC10D2|nr:NAD-dependent epimerase/dehydratase family protein [Massilia sp. TS11]MCG2583618.1 NAD-dependent epimerase/dehydratase family protein [Massilia sp. TS11]